MSGQGSLAGLCAVCYTEQPKYKCPRCKTQTCSLACYKTHQERASCNGQRNPAAFVKKSQWATPAGIDHDYNYLKSVERQIDRANETHARDGNQRHRDRQWAGDSTLQKYLRTHNINVIRAPAGMSRAIANKTRVSGRGFVIWTVEWSEDDHVELDENCPASSSVQELHNTFLGRRAKAERKQAQHAEPARKRRRIEVVADESKPHAGEDASGVTAEQRSQITEDDACKSPPRTAQASADDRQKLKDSPNTAQETADTAESASIAKHFYLLKSGSRSNVKVVVPLTSTDSLTDALAGQTVQEYPTIIVLPYSATGLPSCFKSEAVLLKELQEEAGAVATDRSQTKTLPQPHSLPDAASIIEMLRRDTHTT